MSENTVVRREGVPNETVQDVFLEVLALLLDAAQKLPKTSADASGSVQVNGKPIWFLFELSQHGPLPLKQSKKWN